MKQIPEIDTSHAYDLPAVNTWRDSVHLFDEESVYAIRSALAADRPLLVRGDPGTGKSQLARAAAIALGRKFLCHVVSAHTEIQDLWYRFDAVSRLGDVQIAGFSSPKGASTKEASTETLLDPEKYLSPGIFWWAFDHTSASTQSGKSQHQAYHPDGDEVGDLEKGVVLLIDEIDKADADLPNSLLETLDNGKFTVPWMEHPIGISAERPRPLVIITTNEDRQLPGAFVRRCLVLNLALPEEREAQRDKLKERARAHFGEVALKGREEVLDEVAEQLFNDRKAARSLGVTPPGQAEYLDILHVLSKLAKGSEAQLALLDKIAHFALKKFPGMKR